MNGEPVSDASKLIAAVGLVVVLIMVGYGYYLDYRDRNKHH